MEQTMCQEDMQAYPGFVDEVKENYRARIIALMNKVRQAAIAYGAGLEWVASMPEENNSDSEYSWSFEVVDEGGIVLAVTFTIVESIQHEGTYDGINFHLVTHVQGGRYSTPTLTPYNFTPKVWVKAPEAIEERFAILEDYDYFSVAFGQ